MAIDIPVPKIVPDAPLGGYGLGVYNALTDKAFEQAINKAKAQYAPYNEYANAASRIAYANMLPYQIQATVLSNPLVMQALKNNPQAINSMFSNFTKTVPSGSNVFGGINLPQPGSGHLSGSLLGMLINKLTGGGQQEQPQQPMQQIPMMGGDGMPQQDFMQSQGMQPQQPKGSESQQPALAVPKGAAEQAVTKATSGYGQLKVEGGIPYRTPEGDLVIPATSRLKDTVQNQLLAINNAKDSVKKLAEGSKEFLTPGGYRDLKKAQASNWFEQNVFGIPTTIKNVLGIDKDKVSRYAKFLSEQGQAVENIMNAYNLPANEKALKMVQHIVEPLPGEDKKGYEKRMLDELEKLQERYQRGENILTGGFKVDEKANLPEDTIWMLRPDNVKVPVHKSNVNMAKEKYKYTEVK